MVPIAPPILIQAIGRGLYQFAAAIVLFYLPIVFVNYVHLTATQVGLAIGVGAIAGFVGNFLGGVLADAPWGGRRITILLAAGLSIAATVLLAWIPTLPALVLANVLFGVGTGLYWTAADTAVMDATTAANRQSAFAVMGLFDNLGLGLGTLAGGALLKTLHPEYRIFGVSAVGFGVMLGLFAIGMVETRPERSAVDPFDGLTGWKTAFNDRQLITYLLVNTLFITYLALVNGNLPLYLINDQQIPEITTSNLFTFGYVGLGALLQVPMIRLIAGLSYLTALMLSIVVWGVGFVLVALWQPIDGSLIPALGAFAIFAIATVIYKPTSAAWIAELAPANLRGIYTAIAYQCWAIGYFIGPILGGWALDQPADVTDRFWLGVGLSTGVGLLVLQGLRQRSVGTMDSPIVPELE